MQSLFVVGGIIASVMAAPHGYTGTQSAPPLPSSDLPAPTDLNLKVITLGIGHQNYTCNATTGTYGSNVALASLFDVTRYLSHHPDQVSTLSADRLQQYEEHGDCAEESDYYPHFRQIGEHYFEPTTPAIPDFDLFALDAFLSGKKAADVAAPASDDVDWLELVDNGDGETKNVKAVYRVETAGGKPPASCSGGEHIAVPYAAQYWFYD